MIASLADILRLVAVPILGWAAYRDVQTRRVPNRTWWPLAAVAVAALALDAQSALAVGHDAFFVRVAISLGFVVPLSYGFWRMGGFGGADAKAFIVLAALFPVYPQVELAGTLLPLEPSQLGVFSITILSNTVLVGLAYPLAVAVLNLLRGHVGPAMLLGKPIRWDETTEVYGRLMQDDDGFTRRGLDLDALRMYLQWRGASLDELRADPEAHRNPDSLPAAPNDPGDGSLATDGGRPPADEAEAASDATDDTEPSTDDPWGAEAFLADIDHSAYGTSADQLRAGLDVLVEEDVVWLSPGIPFIVPTFFGLLLGLTYGDVLFVAMHSLGLA